MALRFLFIDFNSYFASVEQQVDKSLRGKPVAVVPVEAETTSCIAASYEAKKFGVKTGTLVRDARLLCPEIIFRPARPPLYVEFHHTLIRIVEKCIPVFSVKSIDEMACELTGRQTQKENAVAIALNIKQTIAAQAGDYLRCSIGIAPNIFLAKTASDMQKPDGLIVIEDQDLPEKILSLELQDFSGIGKRMLKRLYQHGIYSTHDLWNAEKTLLRKVWGGIEGDRMYEKLRGIEPALPLSKHTTIGHSHVLSPEFRTPEGVKVIANRMLQKAAMRLRKMEYRTASLSLSVQYLNKKSWSDDIRFSDTADTLHLTSALKKLIAKIPFADTTPLKVSVAFTHLLMEKAQTRSLFEDDDQESQFNRVIDEVNLKYGKNALYFADAHEGMESSPARIAFNHIPNIALEDGRGDLKKKITKNLSFSKRKKEK